MNIQSIFLLITILLTQINNQTIEYLKQEKVIYFVFPETCFNQFINLQFYHINCLKLTFIKTLGYAIVVLATIGKLPQIINILRAKSTQGLSIFSVFVESIGYVLSIGYNHHFGYPFRTYGELFFLALQNIIILMFFIKYSPDLKTIYKSLFYQLVILLTFYCFFNNMVNDEFYKFNIYCNIMIALMSRLPQILLNLTNKSTGTLSIITTTLFFGGALARLLTIISEITDIRLTVLHILACSLNGILVFQILFFWHSTNLKNAKNKNKYQQIDDIEKCQNIELFENKVE